MIDIDCPCDNYNQQLQILSKEVIKSSNYCWCHQVVNSKNSRTLWFDGMQPTIVYRSKRNWAMINITPTCRIWDEAYKFLINVVFIVLVPTYTFLHIFIRFPLLVTSVDLWHSLKQKGSWTRLICILLG